MNHSIFYCVVVGVGVGVSDSVGVTVGVGVFVIGTLITFIIPAILEWNWQL